MLSDKYPVRLVSWCFYFVLSFLCVGQAWAINTHMFSTTTSSSTQGITLKADLVLVPHSMTIDKQSVTVGDHLEVRAMVQNPDAVERKRVRVRFSCGRRQKDIFIDLRPKQRQSVRTILVVPGPAGVKPVRVEVNPVHRELAERNYSNNADTKRVVAAAKKTLKVEQQKPDYQFERSSPRQSPSLSHAKAFPVITGVRPDQLEAGREYPLQLRGSGLSGSMKLDFGPGIRVAGDVLPYDNFVLVPVVVDVDVAPGKRKITLRVNGESKVQRPTITLVAGEKAVGLTITPSPLVPGRKYQLNIQGANFPPGASAVFDADIQPVGQLQIVDQGNARIEVQVAVSARPGRHPVRLQGQPPVQNAAILAMQPPVVEGYVEVAVPSLKPPLKQVFKPIPITIQPVFSSLRPDRWLPGRSYQVAIRGDRLDVIEAVSFGPGIQVNNLKHRGKTSLVFSLKVEKKTTPGVRFAVVAQNGREEETAVRGWVVKPSMNVTRVPSLVWPSVKDIVLRQGAVFLQEPEWSFSGDMANNHHPVPVLNDETVLAWKEEVPGLADEFEIRFMTPQGTLVYTKIINLGDPAAYVTAFKPGSRFIAELFHQFGTIDRSGTKFKQQRPDMEGAPTRASRSSFGVINDRPQSKMTGVRGLPGEGLATGRKAGFQKYTLESPVFSAAYVPGAAAGSRRMTPVEKYIQDNKNDVSLLWQVVGYKRVNRSPDNVQPAGKKLKSRKLGKKKKEARVSSSTELIEIEISEQWPLHLPDTWPTGVTCDEKDQFELGKIEWSHPAGRKGENHYPGDTMEFGGQFSIKNSPWAISAKTTYKGSGGIIADDSYQFNNVIIDWGDGSWTRLQAMAVESSLPGWSNADLMKFSESHQYFYPGTFQVRMFVVPQDQMDQVDTIVAAHAVRPAKKTAAASDEKTILLASSGQIVSDAGSPGYSLGKGSKTSSAAAGMEMPGSRIFMLYCEPLDVTIVQDTAATGPLHLDVIEVVAFSSDDVAAGPGGAGKRSLKKSGMLLRKVGKKSISAPKSGAKKLRKTNDVHSMTANVDRSGIVSLGEDTTVSSCAGGLWARGRLTYYGQGYARVQWLVDGVVVGSRDVKIGPSELRQDLTADSSSWGEPQRTDYLLESPRLPVKDSGLHRVQLSAVVVPDPTWSTVNAVALQSSLKNLGMKGAGKGNSSKGFRPALPLVIPKGGLQPAVIPISSSQGAIKKTWSTQSATMMKTLKRTMAENRIQPGKALFMPPYSVISPEKRYLVQESTSELPCRFDFPTQEGVFEVAGLKNLQVQNTTYSGSGLLIYKLPDGGPGSTSEHYIPVSFQQWQVPDGLSVQQGVLEVHASEKIDSLPGMTATLTALKGAAGSHLQAVMDVAIKDTTIRLSGSEVPPAWAGVSSPLSADGDWYAAGLHMGRARIGWCMTNIESNDVRLDLSHVEGESPDCGYGGPAWVGIHLGTAILHPYMFDLVDVPLAVTGWGITDAGLCGHAETSSFSHVFGAGSIGWNKLTINAFKSGLNVHYAGFYVDMAWPKVRLEGNDTHFSYSPGSDVDIHLGLDQLPVSTEHYDVIDLKIIPKTFGHAESGWGLQADAELTFRDEQGGLFADAVAVNDLLFSIYGFVEYTGSSIPLDIKGQVGGADEVISALDVTVGGENSRRKMTLDFTTEFSLEGLGRSEHPVHIIYGINKDFNHDAFSTGPEHPAEIVLKSHFPETNPVNSNEFRIKYEHGAATAAGGRRQYAANTTHAAVMDDSGCGYIQVAAGASVSGGGCGNDTFGGHVDTHMFGDSTLAIEGTFRFGEAAGSRYWLAFFRGDNLHVLVYTAIYLEMVQGGLAYNFDHDAFTQDGGFNACPSPGKGVLFSAGLGLSIGGGEADVIRADGVLTIQPSDSYYELLCHALLFNKANLSGRLRYWQSAFDGEIWGDVSLLGDQLYVKAPEHSCGIHVDSGDWKFFMGTRELPVTGHLTSAVQGDAYLVLGSQEGFLVGAKYSQYYNKTSHGWGVAGTVTLGGEVSLALNPLRFDGGLSGHIGGKFVNPVKDIGLGIDTHAWIGCCSPVKFGFGFSVACCCVEGGADIYILPSPDIGAHAKCTCCDPRDWF